MAHASFLFLLAATNALELISTIQISTSPYDRWQAYGQSKTANVLFAIELDGRGEPIGIRAFADHPGAILTELSRHMTDDELRAYGLSRTDSFGSIPAGKSVAEGGDFKTIEQGAATSVWCAASPQLAGMGGYTVRMSTWPRFFRPIPLAT